MSETERERERLELIAEARATRAAIGAEPAKCAEHDKKDVTRMAAPCASLSDPQARCMRARGQPTRQTAPRFTRMALVHRLLGRGPDNPAAD